MLRGGLSTTFRPRFVPPRSQTRGCDVLDGMELVGAQVETEEEYGDYNEEPDFTDGITAAAALGEMEEGGEVEDEDSGNEYGTMEGLMIA